MERRRETALFVFYLVGSLSVLPAPKGCWFVLVIPCRFLLYVLLCTDKNTLYDLTAFFCTSFHVPIKILILWAEEFVNWTFQKWAIKDEKYHIGEEKNKKM